MQEIKWFFKYLRAYPGRNIFVLIISLLEPILYLFPIFITANVIDLITQDASYQVIYKIIVIILPIAIFQSILFFAGSFVNEIIAHRITTDMTRDLFVCMQERSLTYHDQKDAGEIMARATNDTRTVNIAISPGARMILGFLITWAVGLYVLYQIQPLLTLYGIITLFIFVFLVYTYGKRLAPISEASLKAFEVLSEITSNTLTSIRDVKSYVAESWFKRKFAKQATLQAKIKAKEGTLGALFYPEFVVFIFAFGMNAYSLYLAYNKIITIGDLTLIIITMSFLIGMSYEMDWISYYMIGGFAALKRLHATLNERDPGHIKDGNLIYTGTPATIEFQNVSFKYNKAHNYVLKNVSFKVKENETLAIVGGPGSGKSSITKLIQRLYVPNKGIILLGGHDIREYTNASIRKHITTVEQDVFLFNDTVLENIRFGKPEATKEEVMKAAKLAHAHDFIMKLENQYDTLLGENGVRLSGGQAQRIAIARALLLNPSILILDDGASALDANTEIKIQQAISTILQTRTTIITTHRLAIIAKADKIIIMEKGELVGIGTHEKLIKTNPYYRRLFQNHYELPPLEPIQEVKYP